MVTINSKRERVEIFNIGSGDQISVNAIARKRNGDLRLEIST